MSRAPDEKDVRRVAQLLSFDQSPETICEKLVGDGLSQDDAFLAFSAGRLLLNETPRCMHGVPLELVQKLSCSFFRPNTDECEPCARAVEAEEQQQEAETNAFLDRIAARRRAAQN